MKVKEVMDYLKLCNPESVVELNTQCKKTDREIYYQIEEINIDNDDQDFILIEFDT